MSEQKKDGGPEHPDAKLRHLVDAMIDHAETIGVKVTIKLRWPTGYTFSQRPLNARELKAEESRRALSTRSKGQTE
jgi:hypothetical protein